jgi:hypothetical protein
VGTHGRRLGKGRSQYATAKVPLKVVPLECSDAPLASNAALHGCAKPAVGGKGAIVEQVCCGYEGTGKAGIVTLATLW